MNHDYADIRSRIPEEPKWWDERAVPRYSEFSPSETADIYAHKCCLMLIECQGCGQEFKVAFSQSALTLVMHPEEPDLADSAKNKTLHYGDPPNVRCCSGTTMNSVPVRILEFWERQQAALVWLRVPELETDVKPDWAKRDA